MSRLSAVQVQRAIESAGGLWTVPELRRIGVLRWGDPLPEHSVVISPLHLHRQSKPVASRRYAGYDMLRLCEEQGRAASAEDLDRKIKERLRLMQSLAHRHERIPASDDS